MAKPSWHWTNQPNSKVIRDTISQSLMGRKTWNKGLIGYKAGKKHWHWKGGRIIENGYVKLYRPDHPDSDRHGYISEHRLKMERKLGRRLLRTEIVHHKNRDKQDNRIANLELISSQSQHIREHFDEMRPGWRIKGVCPPWLMKHRIKPGEVLKNRNKNTQ